MANTKAKQNTVGFFSSGDGSTTFRTPVIVDFARGGSVGSVGVYTADQNKKHSHNVGTGSKTDKTTITGAFAALSLDISSSYSVLADRKPTGVFSVQRRGYDGGAMDRTYDGDLGTDIYMDATHDHNITIQQTGTNAGGNEVLVKNIIMPYFLRALNI